MAQLDFLDIFEDCITRLAIGQTIDDCLQAYPDYASRLRPMLETTQAVQTADLVSEVEQSEDIPIIWEIIQQKQSNRVPIAILPRRRSRHIRTQLLIAIILLLLLTITSWFFLSRPDLPNITVPIVDTLTLVPTQTNTVEPLIIDDILITETVVDITPSPTYTKTSTVTITPSATASPTYTLTSTQTVTPSPTHTLVPSQTPLPTATFVPGCDAPTSVTEASDLVLEIYPNTTIVSARQVTRFGDRLVWEIITSHGIEVAIDVGCGHILTIERDDDSESTTSPTNSNEGGISNTNINGSSSSSNINDNNNTSSGSSSDFNTNDNSDDGNDNDNNSNDNDDNSGMGSDDGADDNSGMGSDDD